jgi:hypothetical protein
MNATDSCRPNRTCLLKPIKGPVEPKVRAIADLIQASYVFWLGLDEDLRSTVQRAQAVHPVIDLFYHSNYHSLSEQGMQSLFPSTS